MHGTILKQIDNARDHSRAYWLYQATGEILKSPALSDAQAYRLARDVIALVRNLPLRIHESPQNNYGYILSYQWMEKLVKERPAIQALLQPEEDEDTYLFMRSFWDRAAAKRG